MVETYRGFDKAFKYLFDNATEVSATALYNSGTNIGSITIDGQTLNFYIPSSGGSTVSYNEGLQSGTLVGTLTIDGVSHNLYCTAVEANPQGQATATLNTISIDGTVYDIQGGGGGIAHHYSTSEHIVGTWIDGKTLYERTLTVATMPNNTVVSHAHGISGVDAIWVFDGFARNSTTGYVNPLNLPNSSTSGQWYTNVDRTNINIWAGSDRRAYDDVKITVRYTKL